MPSRRATAVVGSLFAPLLSRRVLARLARARSSDPEPFLAALREAGYQVASRSLPSGTLVEVIDKHGKRVLEFLVSFQLLERSALPWRRALLLPRLAPVRPGTARPVRRLLLGYEPSRQVFAAWEARGTGRGAAMALPVPRETLASAAQEGLAMHVPRNPELVTAFRSDAVREYLEALPALDAARTELETPAAEAERGGRPYDLVLAPESELSDALRSAGDLAQPPEVPQLQEPPRRRRGVQLKTPEPATANRKNVATGFAAREDPETPLDRLCPLVPSSDYYFWFEIGAPHGSIEEQPSPVPASVPANARLVVQLFSFAGELEIVPSASRGVLELTADGGARVLEPASKPEASASAQARLLFPVRTPSGGGQFKLRCNLYYGATLVQSRLIRARVGGRSRPPRSALRSSLDYSLSAVVSAAALTRVPGHDLSMQFNGSPGTHQLRVFGRGGTSEFDASSTIDSVGLQGLINEARTALGLITWGTEAPFEEGDRYCYRNGVTDAEFERDLITLAIKGYRLYDGLVDELSEDRTEQLEAWTAATRTVQIATTNPSAYVPVGLFYDYPIHDGEWSLDTFKICPAFEQALAGDAPLEQCACFAGQCPSRGDRYTVCPSGFWGFRHELGWPMSAPASGFESNFSGRPQLTVGVATDLALYSEHADRIRALGDGGVVETPDELFEQMRQHLHLVYLYCHGGLIGKTAPFVQIGAKKSTSITRASLRAEEISWEEPRPLVFLNGCHTTALAPEQAISLVTGFMRAKALGVIGTEVTVFEGLACAFAEQMLPSFMDGSETIGTATRKARLALLHRRNPLGLVYIPFIAARARLVSQPAGASGSQDDAGT